MISMELGGEGRRGRRKYYAEYHNCRSPIWAVTFADNEMHLSCVAFQIAPQPAAYSNETCITTN